MFAEVSAFTNCQTCSHQGADKLIIHGNWEVAGPSVLA